MSGERVDAVGPCVMKHRRVPAVGEVVVRADGSELVGDGEFAVWDRAADGGRVVGAAHTGALLCKGHRHRLLELIAAAPQVVAWIGEHIEPSSQVADQWAVGFTTHAKGDPPVPLSLAAVDAIDEQLHILAEWAVEVASDRCEPLPVLPGVRWRHRSALRTNALSPYAALTPEQLDAVMPDRVVIGFRATDAAARDRTITALCGFLVDRIDWVIEQPWVEEMLTELGALRGVHRSLWPFEDTARAVRDFRCPTCDRMTVVVHPPAGPPVQTVVLEPRLDWAGEPIMMPIRVETAVDGKRAVQWVQSMQKRMVTHLAHPVLVVCSDRRCGAVVDRTLWSWVGEAAASGRPVHEISRPAPGEVATEVGP